MSAPHIASLFCAALLFLGCLGLLHPRYAINDDLKIISVLAGYPAGNPAPFPIFSNAALGLVLMPLYGLGTALNWEILLFVLVDLLSVWALLYLLFSAPAAAPIKYVGAAVLLASSSYFALNITFTNAAGLACFAGLCLIIASARSTRLPRWEVASGIALVLMGSLIRIQMLALAMPMILAPLPFIMRSLRLRNLTIAAMCAGLAVCAGLAFDRLFVRAHMDWNTYYFYNKTAQKVQDAHRLANAGLKIRHISWSSNDQELFARSFFPDEGIYSVERLQYLIDHVPGTGQDPMGSGRTLLQRLSVGKALPVSVLPVVLWLLALATVPSSRKKLAITTVLLACMAENIFLQWFYKNPDYSLFCLLANAAALELLMLSWSGAPDAEAIAASPQRQLSRATYYSLMSATLVLIAILVNQAVLTSDESHKRENAYHGILADIKDLQAQGKLAPDAIIVSPSHGIPWEWSNPLTLDLPEVPFLDTGWITFSPSYEGALQRFDLQPLPERLYQKPNVYVMTKRIFEDYLVRYYEEHLHIMVAIRPIYTIPEAYRTVENEDTQLYKVELVK